MGEKIFWRGCYCTFLVLGLLLSGGCDLKDDDDDQIQPGTVDVYVSGYSQRLNQTNDTRHMPCFWKNGTRTDLSVIDVEMGGSWAAGIFVSGNDVHIAGKISNSGGYGVACYWKNGARTDLIGTGSNINSDAYGVYATGSDVYIIGYGTGSWAIPCYWLNKVVHDLSRPDINSHGFTGSIFGSGSDIFIGGSVGRDNNSYSNACYWKNGVRSEMPNITIHTYVDIKSVGVSGSDVYLAGYWWLDTDFNGGKYVAVPAIWKNNVRSDLSVANAALSSEARGISIANGDVYVSGYSNEGSDLSVPCFWKNGARSELSRVDTGKSGMANGVFLSGKDVYFVGYTTNASNVKVPCYWKNGVRTDLSVIDATKHGIGYSIFVVTN